MLPATERLLLGPGPSPVSPRVLSALHAGPLLFGDWGTSRLYVLGLAFYFTAHASIFYLTAISVLMAAASSSPCWCRWCAKARNRG